MRKQVLIPDEQLVADASNVKEYHLCAWHDLDRLRNENHLLAITLLGCETGFRIGSGIMGCGPVRIDPLTATERKVFPDFVKGLSHRQVARNHCISISHAASCKSAIKKKLGLKEFCPKENRQDVKPFRVPSKKLTAAESRVYPYFKRGVSPRDVAGELGLSLSTVTMQRKSLCRRLGITLDELCPKEKRSRMKTDPNTKDVDENDSQGL